MVAARAAGAQDLRHSRPRIHRAGLLPRHLRLAARCAVGPRGYACPICKSSERVGFYCWRNNHPGRRICAMDTHYFAISRRYKCHTCAGQAAAMKAAAVAAAAVAAPSLAVAEADGEVDDAALDDEITEFEKEWL